MKLKRLDNYLDFMVRVQKCEGDVTFLSGEGDRLDLRSALPQFLFAVACSDRDYTEQGSIECSRQSDYEMLGEFLEQGT